MVSASSLFQSDADQCLAQELSLAQDMELERRQEDEVK